MSYIRRGELDGARLVTGGIDDANLPTAGYFVRPTVFSDVTPEMAIAQEEIFGPVLLILPYDDIDEAVSMANGTIYGIAGAVWSNDEGEARRIARRLQAAQIEVNGGLLTLGHLSAATSSQALVVRAFISASRSSSR